MNWLKFSRHLPRTTSPHVLPEQGIQLKFLLPFRITTGNHLLPRQGQPMPKFLIPVPTHNQVKRQGESMPKFLIKIMWPQQG